MTLAKANLPPLPAGIVQRLLSRDQVAAYLGVCAGTLDSWVKAEVMPEALQLPGKQRRWDLVAVNRALDLLSGLGAESGLEARRAAARERMRLLSGRDDDEVRHQTR